MALRPVNVRRKTNPSPRINVRIKNRGSHPHVLYNASGQPVRFAVGETKEIEMPAVHANKIRERAIRGGNLLVINAADVQDKVSGKKRIRVSDPVDGKRSSATSVKAAPNMTGKRPPSRASGKPAKPAKNVIRPEIETPAQLLAAMTDGDPLQYNHFVSVAFRVLPEGAVQPGANKAAIWSALEAEARR